MSQFKRWTQAALGRSCLMALPAALLLAPIAAHAIKEVDPGPAKFPPVTLVAGQNIRVTLANVAKAPDGSVVPAPCEVKVSFFDVFGVAVENPTTRDLRPGQSAAVNDRASFSFIGLSRHRRATVEVVVPAVQTDAPRACEVVTALEVFNVLTGMTQFIQNPAVLQAGDVNGD